MSEDIVDLQRDLVQGSSNNTGTGDKKFMRFMCLFIWANGRFIEKLVDNLDPQLVEPKLKRDLWEHVALTDKFLTYSNQIKNDTLLIPDGVVTTEYGDVGQYSKVAFGRLVEGMALIASGLKLNLKEIFKIAKDNM